MEAKKEKKTWLNSTNEHAGKRKRRFYGNEKKTTDHEKKERIPNQVKHSTKKKEEKL